MRANKDIRDAVEEKGFRLWELAEALGLSSDASSIVISRDGSISA